MGKPFVANITISDILMIVGVLSFAVTDIIHACKGTATLTSKILHITKDAFLYFVDEATGSVEKKINAATGFALFIGAVVFLALIVKSSWNNSPLKGDLVFHFFLCVIAMIVLMHLCAKFTRHRP